MFSRFVRDERGFFFIFGALGLIAVVLIYVFVGPTWFVHHAAAGAHHHGRNTILYGLVQGFFVPFSLFWHYVMNSHIYVIPHPTVTFGWVVGFIVGICALVGLARA